MLNDICSPCIIPKTMHWLKLASLIWNMSAISSSGSSGTCIGDSAIVKQESSWNEVWESEFNGLNSWKRVEVVYVWTRFRQHRSEPDLNPIRVSRESKANPYYGTKQSGYQGIFQTMHRSKMIHMNGSWDKDPRPKETAGYQNRTLRRWW